MDRGELKASRQQTCVRGQEIVRLPVDETAAVGKRSRQQGEEMKYKKRKAEKN